MSPHDDAMTAAHPWADDVPAYALGALDPDERARFEAHLAGCDACRDELRAFHEVAALLAHDAPPATPPASLRARILAEAATADRVTAERPAVRVTTGSMPAVSPDRPAAGADVLPFPTARAEPVRARTARAPWLAAAVALIAALGATALWTSERAARVAAERVAAGATRLAAEERAARTERDSLLAAVLAPDVRLARLAATGAAPQVRVFWARQRGMVVLTAASLPEPARGRTYQLWGIAAGGKPQGLGTFVPSAAGEARVVLRVPTGAAMDIAAITEEPTGGSPQPTSAPILAGPLGRD